MKLVIEIPEDDFYMIQRVVEMGIGSSVDNIIACGTQLPKGHGRLIDADRVITEATENMKYPANHKYMECVIAHMKLAPTIIEADKGEPE